MESLTASRLFITGLSGLLGLNAAWQCREQFSVSGCYWSHPVAVEGIDAARLDAADAGRLLALISRQRPHVILNTVGLTDVEACEADPALARRINVETARNAAAAARAVGARLIHISTDHLFSGQAALLDESAAAQPLNEYARTKLEAERVVLRLCPDALVVRTNFFGWGTSLRASFTDWILRSLASGQSVSMFTDVFFTPLLVNDLVAIALELSARGAQGIFNVAGRERISKYDFGVRVAQTFGYPLDLMSPRSVEGFPFSAPRPRDMSLSGAKAEKYLGRQRPSVAESLAGLRRLQQQGWPESLEAAVRAGVALPAPLS